MLVQVVYILCAVWMVNKFATTKKTLGTSLTMYIHYRIIHILLLVVENKRVFEYSDYFWAFFISKAEVMWQLMCSHSATSGVHV